MLNSGTLQYNADRAEAWSQHVAVKIAAADLGP